MKSIYLFIVVTLISFGTKAQNNQKVIHFFKAKNVDSIIKYCELPFNLSAGTTDDDDNIKDINVLKSKLRKLLKQNYFNGFLKGKQTVNKSSINFEKHSYNKDGEMESESSIMFNFKKSKDGKIKLYQIFMAG